MMSNNTLAFHAADCNRHGSAGRSSFRRIKPLRPSNRPLGGIQTQIPLIIHIDAQPRRFLHAVFCNIKNFSVSTRAGSIGGIHFSRFKPARDASMVNWRNEAGVAIEVGSMAGAFEMLRHGEEVCLDAAGEWDPYARRVKPRLLKAASSRRTPESENSA